MKNLCQKSEIDRHYHVNTNVQLKKLISWFNCFWFHRFCAIINWRTPGTTNVLLCLALSVLFLSLNWKLFECLRCTLSTFCLNWKICILPIPVGLMYSKETPKSRKKSPSKVSDLRPPYRDYFYTYIALHFFKMYSQRI